MLNQWTNNIQLRFWEKIIDLLPRIKPLIKLLWSLYQAIQIKNVLFFLLKISAIAAGGFITGILFYVISNLLR